MTVGNTEWTLQDDGSVLLRVTSPAQVISREHFAGIVAEMSERSRLGDQARADAQNDAWIVLSLNERDRELGLSDLRVPGSIA